MKSPSPVANLPDKIGKKSTFECLSVKLRKSLPLCLLKPNRSTFECEIIHKKEQTFLGHPEGGCSVFGHYLYEIRNTG